MVLQEPQRGMGGPMGGTLEVSALAAADPGDRRANRRLQDLPPGQPRRKAMDEVRRSARSVRMDLHISTCTVKPADLGSLQVGAGRPPLIAAPCRPHGNESWRTSEDLSDAAFERWVVTEMPISLPKTHNELVRVSVLDHPGNGRRRTSSRLTHFAGRHVVSLARVRSSGMTGNRWPDVHRPRRRRTCLSAARFQR
jgi:hypothetical protein